MKSFMDHLNQLMGFVIIKMKHEAVERFMNQIGQYFKSIIKTNETQMI